MKFTTLALAIALALPSTYALARGVGKVAVTSARSAV